MALMVITRLSSGSTSARCRVCCHGPSSMVLVDAVNARRPLLVSDAGDLPEVVREHGVGEIVARDDVDGLADALWRAYHRGFDVPAGAFERAAAELSLSSSVDRWDAILGEVLKRRGR